MRSSAAGTGRSRTQVGACQDAILRPEAEVLGDAPRREDHLWWVIITPLGRPVLPDV